jgi:septal ring factor EnvC (AmiA/AmiB activator)
MKMKIAILIVASIVAVASLCVADSSSSSPKPAGDLAALRTELQQTQEQLEGVIARTSALEQQVRSLEQSTAKLQQEVRRLQVPHLSPWQTNQGPHLIPLQTK